MYGAKTRTLTRTSIARLQSVQRKMERSLLSITVRGKTRNEEIHRRTGAEDMTNRITRAKSHG